LGPRPQAGLSARVADSDRGSAHLDVEVAVRDASVALVDLRVDDVVLYAAIDNGYLSISVGYCSIGVSNRENQQGGKERRRF
jgi:hypothetical protein